MSFGLIILAGGKSSRMGRDKASLPWEGAEFLEQTVQKAMAYGFEDIIVSSSLPNHQQKMAAKMRDNVVRVIPDSIENVGPMGGLLASLKEAKCDYYLAISIDMPFFDFSFLDEWKQRYTIEMKERAPLIIPIVEGRLEPLAGLYSPKAIPTIETLIAAREYRIRELFRVYPTIEVDMTKCKYIYRNINTPAEYKVALGKLENTHRRVPVVSIVASKSKTGKTTVITQLVSYFASKGIRVGVVKSDGHDFQMDRPDSDTHRASQAGAAVVAIASPNRVAVINHTNKPTDLLSLSQSLEVDLVILESRSRGVFPIIELYRDGYNTELLTPAEKLVAVVTDDTKIVTKGDIFSFGWTDLEKLGPWIFENLI